MATRSIARSLVLVGALGPLAFQGYLPGQATVAAQNGRQPQLLGPAAVDVPSVSVRPRFRLNGRAFPGPDAGVARFTLWASDGRDLFDGPQLVLGETHLPRQTIRVIPGVYDVYYSWVSGTDVPRNRLTRVLQAVLIDRDRELVVDVPMIHIAGVKHHNGAPFGYDGAAALGLRGVDWPGEVDLGGAQPEEFEVAIIPGRYAFEYDWQQGVFFPHNRHGVVRRLTLAESVEGLVLNVPSVVQPLEFLHNGAPFPSSPFDRGDLVLRRGEREEVLAGSSHEGDAAIRMIPGTYDAHWRHVVGANVPGNSDARIRGAVVANGAPRVIDVPSLEVSGSFFVNGQPTPQSEFENARVSLRRRTGDTLILGQTRYGAYVTRVVPGVYDIVYDHLTGASTLPANRRATLEQDWRVQSSPLHDIDIPVGIFKGTFELNGESFGSSEFDSGQIYAVPVAVDQDPVPLGRTHYGGFEHRLLPGAYRAGYAHVVGAGVPANAFTTFGPRRRVYEGTETVATLDVPAGPLEVFYLHNGTPIPDGGAQNARVHLLRGRDYLRLPDSVPGPREIVAMEGRFDLYYQFRGDAAKREERGSTRSGCGVRRGDPARRVACRRVRVATGRRRDARRGWRDVCRAVHAAR